ncbi:hypothetical protein SAMN05216517_10962 [Janthinobacterium sp. OK676]|uniref:hypothetical protein n=1 Tax=Janthinobacterium sp. OK676 TaxID=1855295 RepID=UPI0008821A37|nr:hypothetical protein [Janthinobacterium sp. OK676]SDN23243.1 hypothetical protein SAMN05216517_10962 [Janthinobacterium sp. OK676]
MTAIKAKVVSVDTDVFGEQWTVGDIDELARIIAIVAIGQAEHASIIVRELQPQKPALSMILLFAQAKKQMNVIGKSDQVRYQRDGFLFECISWIKAQQAAHPRQYLKVPHIKSTTQGMDGLMIELHATKPQVIRSMIFEDKCTSKPRDKFRDEVLVTFGEHHRHERSADLLSTAISLIKESGLDGSAATKAAGAVMDIAYRTYRAALTVDATINTPDKRSNLFKDYTALDGITQKQRVGAVFVPDESLREWFQKLSDQVVHALTQFENDHV